MIKELLTRGTLRKIITLFCIVTFLVCAVPQSIAGTDAKIVITGAKPTELSPGDTKEITLTVKNAGSNDAKQVTFNFLESQYISVVGPSSVCINSLNGWCSKDVDITVHVSEGAPSGSHAIPVTCTFSQYDSSGSPGSVTETMPEVTYTIVFRVEEGGMIDVSDVDMAELNLGEETKLILMLPSLRVPQARHRFLLPTQEIIPPILLLSEFRNRKISRFGVAQPLLWAILMKETIQLCHFR